MLCNQIQQQLALANSVEKSEASPSLQIKLPPPEETLNAQERLKEYQRNYARTHREQFRAYGKKSYRKNYATYRAKRGTAEYKAKLRAYLKKHRAKYPERHRASIRRYQKEHPEYFQQYRATYGPRRRELYQQNREAILARKRELQKTGRYSKRHSAYLRKQRLENVQFMLAGRLRATLNRAFRRNWARKSRKSMELLGCSVEEAKRHIESQFTGAMNWDDRRSFVIDHVIPVVAFDLTDDEEASWAGNWRNLQPLTRHDNAVKQGTIPNPLPSWLPSHIVERIQSRSK